MREARPMGCRILRSTIWTFSITGLMIGAETPVEKKHCRILYNILETKFLQVCLQQRWFPFLLGVALY
jgi:hypothetical protein